MDNHYHLLVKTPKGNLSRAMRHINGVYTQRCNRWAKKDGPLFRARYKAIIVEKDAYLLQVSRYIHLNPVVAKIVTHPE
jgi:REP element-mobilizing transposase RayT